MKARNLIPGWPRGRSTSRPLRYNRKIAAFFATERFFINEAPFFDHGRAALEWADRAIEADENQAEERRKLAMMEAFWAEKMNEAAGPVNPDSLLRIAVAGFSSWMGNRLLALFMERMQLHGVGWTRTSSDMWGRVTLEFDQHGR